MQRQLTTQQRDAFVDEVCDVVDDEALDSVVEWAFDEAWSAFGLEVFHIPARGQHGEESAVVRLDRAIYLSPNGTPGTARLWDLLHEIGHAEQAPPPDDYVPAKTAECFTREREAWAWGWRRASRAWPLLDSYAEEFRRHAARMAASYDPNAPTTP